MLERYDRVVYLHGAGYDFMGRIEAAGIPVKSGSAFRTIPSSTNYLVVVAVVAASTLAGGFFFVLKKKKQD